MEVQTRVNDVERLVLLQTGKRRLTAEEVEYVLSHHTTETIGSMRKKLGVRWDTLKARMDEMGLSVITAGQRWPQDDIDTLRSMAKAGKTVKQISECLGRTENAVQLTARRYDIEIYMPGRLWRPEDKEYLRRNWGYVRLDTICKKLHRSSEAVSEQARLMKLGAVYTRSEDIPLQEFVRATGIGEYRVVYTLAPKYGFPLVKRKAGKRQYYWFVGYERIMQWLYTHQDLYDGSLIQEDFFVEPDWLKEKRRRDREDNSYLAYYIRRQPWTERELSMVKSLGEQGWSPTEISTRIDRSPGAIANKLVAIREQKKKQREGGLAK